MIGVNVSHHLPIVRFCTTGFKNSTRQYSREWAFERRFISVNRPCDLTVFRIKFVPAFHRIVGFWHSVVEPHNGVSLFFHVVEVVPWHHIIYLKLSESDVLFLP